MRHSSGTTICYNGECYNYRQLRAELEMLGHRFETNTDTEVVLVSFVQWGEAALDRLRGMFAIALWDPIRKQTFLVRDRLGIKPLYYYEDRQGVLFSSEVRSLLSSGLISRNVDRESIVSYLWHGFIPGDRTIVEGIRLLPPGSVMSVDSAGKILSVRRYWELPAKAQNHTNTKDVADELQEAIGLRLVSDVPLGIFLSGGVDSSVIASIAQQISDEKLKTFNVRFEEAAFDESSFARDVATALGTDHHEILLTEQNFSDTLDEALSSLDQPTFDGINTYFVSKAVKEAGLTVALSGAGGDELFGGYSSFKDLPRAQKLASLAAILPERSRGWLAGAAVKIFTQNVSEVPPQTRWGKLADVLATKGDIVNLYQVAYSLFTRNFQQELLLEDSSDSDFGIPETRFDRLSARYGKLPALTAISAMELESFVSERLLRDTDSTSMAVALEVRVPLLDHRFVEMAFGLDERDRFQPLGAKKFLRDMAIRRLPASIFDRKKAGFELPLEHWCRSRLQLQLKESFTDLNLAHSIGLNGEAIARLWRAFEAGGSGLYWSRVWSIFVLMNWCSAHDVHIRN